MKIRLRDVQLNQLNNKSLQLAAQYTRLLRATSGVKLKLYDRDLLVKISESARSTGNDYLIALYGELKEQIRLGVFESIKSNC